MSPATSCKKRKEVINMNKTIVGLLILALIMSSSACAKPHSPISEADGPASNEADLSVSLELSPPAEPVSDPAEETELTGKWLTNSAAIFAMPGQPVLGTEDDLAAWNSVIAQCDQIAKILISTWEPERDLTKAEARSILDSLEKLKPEIMEKMGNPPTGGDTNIIAYDSSGTERWRLAINSSWFTVCMSGDDTPRLFSIKGQDFSPAAPTLETSDNADAWNEEARAAVERVIAYNQEWVHPGYADAKPNGTDLYYKDKTVRIPYDYELGSGFDAIFVDESMAAFAYTPLEGDDPILLLCSEDQGETWVNAEISMEGKERPEHMYVTFAGKNTGYLVVKYNENTYLFYTTHDIGKTWELSNLGELPEPTDIYGIAAKANTVYLYGETKDSIVIYTNHNDGEVWKTTKLPLTEQEYARSHITEFWYAPDESPLVIQLFVKEPDENRMHSYYVSLDDGENWRFFNSEKGTE